MTIFGLNNKSLNCGFYNNIYCLIKNKFVRYFYFELSISIIIMRLYMGTK